MGAKKNVLFKIFAYLRAKLPVAIFLLEPLDIFFLFVFFCSSKIVTRPAALLEATRIRPPDQELMRFAPHDIAIFV